MLFVKPQARRVPALQNLVDLRNNATGKFDRQFSKLEESLTFMVAGVPPELKKLASEKATSRRELCTDLIVFRCFSC